MDVCSDDVMSEAEATIDATALTPIREMGGGNEERIQRRWKSRDSGREREGRFEKGRK